MKDEKDYHTIDYAVGLLKAQNYTGKLKSLVNKVINAVEEIIKHVEDGQILKDCQFLLMEILAPLVIAAT
ncbi:MAG: hypothetical protein F6K24_50160 [Okeania sp. SIO2D1]|nr:hypothetical protein [Okeania sp. SIO2D1]